MARSIGADHVIDYTQEDFTRNGQRYDLILAVNGYHPILAYRRALSPRGNLCRGRRSISFIQAHASRAIGFEDRQTENWFYGDSGNIKKICSLSMSFLKPGKVVPVIDRCYPLSETAEAIQYLDRRTCPGKSRHHCRVS